jgi:hypothetical protein
MDFSPNVEEFVTEFMKKTLKTPALLRHHTATEENELNKNYAQLHLKLLQSDKLIKKQRPVLLEQPIKALPENNSFLPESIRTYIRDENKHILQYSQYLANRTINIYLVFFQPLNIKNKKKYDEVVRRMYMWLSICIMQASGTTCAQNSLQIYVYLTPFKKVLPPPYQVLGVENVNTAFTYACAKDGQIIIYREEEWFKVFLHETMHTFGMDLGASDVVPVFNALRQMFPGLNSTFSVAETYAEMWARIMNCAFQSYFTLSPAKRNDSKMFAVYMDFTLELERVFAMQQSEKILHYMGLSYEKLFLNESATLQKYQENTHVFAYYILTAVLLEDYALFLQWSFQNNERFIAFNRTKDNREAFKNFVVARLQANKSKRQSMPFCPQDPSTRMSVVELI